MKKVWIVEHRIYNAKCNCMEILVAYVASSFKKAESFIKSNTDFDSGFWWWAVYPEAVDQFVDVDELAFFSAKGKRLRTQPSRKK